MTPPVPPVEDDEPPPKQTYTEEDLAGLKSALKAERAQHRRDVAELKTQVDAAAKKSADPPPAKPTDPPLDLEHYRAKWRSEWDAQELAPVRLENDKSKEELRKIRLNERAARLAVENGMIPEYATDEVELLVMRGKLDLTADGKLLVKDDDGEVASMTPEKFFREHFRKAKPHVYRAPDTRGAGFEGGPGGGRKASDLSATEKIALGLSKLPSA